MIYHWKVVGGNQYKAFYMKEEEGIPFNDELQLQHEEYIHELESWLELILSLLKRITTREEITSERMQYVNFQKDPDRLQQRGTALTKQLTMEEKKAKRIKKDYPDWDVREEMSKNAKFIKTLELIRLR
jgi:hypothetical protein